MTDIRWEQRFFNYAKALRQLNKAVLESKQRELSNLEEQGLIKAFEFTYELAWSVIKDFFEYQGNTEITGSRDAFRDAFQKGIINNGELWMEMIKSRNKTVHIYNEGTAHEISKQIADVYLGLFIELYHSMYRKLSASNQHLFSESLE